MMSEMEKQQIADYVLDQANSRQLELRVSKTAILGPHSLTGFWNEASPQQAAGYQEENLLMMRNHGFSTASLAAVTP